MSESPATSPAIITPGGRQEIWCGTFESCFEGEIFTLPSPNARTLPCRISTTTADAPNVPADTWPSTFQLRFVARTLIDDIARREERPRPTFFLDFTPCEEFDKLRQFMTDGIGGYLRFDPPTTVYETGMRVLFISYCPENRAYEGWLSLTGESQFAAFTFEAPIEIQSYAGLVDEVGRPGSASEIQCILDRMHHFGKFPYVSCGGAFTGKLCQIWHGTLELSMPCSGPGPEHRLTTRMACHVSASVVNHLPEIEARSWPSVMTLNFFPDSIVGNIGARNERKSKSVLFQFNTETDVALLRFFMTRSPHQAAYAELPPPPNNSNAPFKLLILVFKPSEEVFVGLVANDPMKMATKLERALLLNARKESRRKMQECNAVNRGLNAAPGTVETNQRRGKRNERIAKKPDREAAEQVEHQSQDATADMNVKLRNNEISSGPASTIPEECQLGRATEEYLLGHYNAAVIRYKEYIACTAETPKTDEQLHYDLIVNYLICACLLQSENLSDLCEARSRLANLEATFGSRYPMIYLGLARFYLKLFSFNEADLMATKGLSIPDSEDLPTCLLPESSTLLPESTKDQLEQLLLDIKDQCTGFHAPDARCFMESCRTTCQDNFCGRDIFIKSPAFRGMVTTVCSNRGDPCKIHFHMPCWRLKKDGASRCLKISDREVLLNWKCLTPDCGTVGQPSLIKKIRIQKEDGGVVDVDPPAEKSQGHQQPRTRGNTRCGS